MQGISSSAIACLVGLVQLVAGYPTYLSNDACARLSAIAGGAVATIMGSPTATGTALAVSAGGLTSTLPCTIDRSEDASLDESDGATPPHAVGPWSSLEPAKAKLMLKRITESASELQIMGISCDGGETRMCEEDDYQYLR